MYLLLTTSASVHYVQTTGKHFNTREDAQFNMNRDVEDVISDFGEPAFKKDTALGINLDYANDSLNYFRWQIILAGEEFETSVNL